MAILQTKDLAVGMMVAQDVYSKAGQLIIRKDSLLTRQMIAHLKYYFIDEIEIHDGELPEEIQQYVSAGQMSAAHGRTIINIPDKQKQKDVADKIIRNDLSVRATEKLADRIKDELKPERKRRKKSSDEEIGKTPEMKAVEAELRSLIGTKVNIRGDEKKGRIEMEYYSLEELNRLIDILREAGK